MDMSGWSYVDDPLSAAWRSSVQRDREGANLDIRIVFQLFVQTLPLRGRICVSTTSSLEWFPLSFPFVGRVGFRPTSRFGLRCGPSVCRDVVFLQVPCVARLHLLAPGEALTVVAQEHAVYKRVKVEGPFRPRRMMFTSDRYGSMGQWRDSDTIIQYSWNFLFGLKRTWDQKLSSGLMLLTFMTTHLFQLPMTFFRNQRILRPVFPPHHEEQRWHPQDYSPMSCCRVARPFLRQGSFRSVTKCDADTR